MPHERTKVSAHRNDAPRASAVKLVAVAAVMALLAGCAVKVPLREIAPSGQILAGTLEDRSECANAPQCVDDGADDAAYRPTSAGGSYIEPDDDTEAELVLDGGAAAVPVGRAWR